MMFNLKILNELLMGKTKKMMMIAFIYKGGV